MKNNQSIAIIGGLGHVGLPLGLLFANKNFNVFDIKPKTAYERRR